MKTLLQQTIRPNRVFETQDLSHIHPLFKNKVVGKSRDYLPNFIQVGYYVKEFDFVITNIKMRSDDVEVAEGYLLEPFLENKAVYSHSECAHTFHNPLYEVFEVREARPEEIATEQDYINHHIERQNYWSNLPEQDLSCIVEY